MKRHAFTLIEVLVVIGIIAVVAAIVFPVVASAKESGRSAVCVSNMRQLAMATLLYTDSNGAAPRLIGSNNTLQDTLGLSKQEFIQGSPTNRVGTLVCPDYGRPQFTDRITGFALNECYMFARQIPEPSNSVLLSEVAAAEGTFENGEPGGGGIREFIAFPDSFRARLGFHDWVQTAEEHPIGQWGDKRHRGKGHYAMIDGHVATFATGQFRIPVRDKVCRLNALNWEGPEGGPKFALEEFEVRRR